MNWTNEEKLELYAKAQMMSATDEGFRAEMLADPIAALEKVSGKKIPAGVKIKVVEQDPDYTSTVVLPAFVGDELENEALDNVAGGSLIVTISHFVGGPSFVF